MTMNDDLSSFTADFSSSHCDKNVIVSSQVTGSGKTVRFKQTINTMIDTLEKVAIWKKALLTSIIDNDIEAFNQHISALGVYRNNGIHSNNRDAVEIYEQSSPLKLGSFPDNFTTCLQKVESEEGKHRVVEFFAQKHLNFYPDLILSLILHQHSLIDYMPEIFKQIDPEDLDLAQYRSELAQNFEHDPFQPIMHRAYATIIHYVEQSMLHDKLNAELIEHDDSEFYNNNDNSNNGYNNTDTPVRKKIGGKI
jgi:hypothetical protein